MMIPMLTKQHSYVAMVGLLDQFWAENAGRVRNPGQVRQINGFSIDLEGKMPEVVTTSTFTPGVGVRTYRPETAAGLLSSDTLSVLQTLPADVAPDWNAFQAVRSADASAYVAAVPETVEVIHRPVHGPETVSDFGFLPDLEMDPAELTEFRRAQLTRDGELVLIERQLQAEFGPEVKVAYDPYAEEYLMLRPGQPGYDATLSAQAAFDRTISELWKLDLDRAPFQDLIDKYGSRA